jgi:Family of unknown function (DUF5678)
MPRNVFNENGLQAQLAALSGRWVAIRDDHVIADANTLGELIRDDRVERTDTRMAVPQRHDAPITHP